MDAAQHIMRYNCKILFTAVLLFMASLTAPSLKASEIIMRKVKEGESLSSLARDYNCSIQEIKDLNGLKRSTLYKGEELKIPQSSPDHYTVRRGDTLSGIALKWGIPQEKLISLNRMHHEILKVGQTLELIRPPFKGETWKVRPGDSLSWLSLKFDISQERLKQINHLKENTLHTGQILHLTTTIPQTITVKEGDTLWGISRQYGIKVPELQHWNKLSSDTLAAGMTLQLYPEILELDTKDLQTSPKVPGRQPPAQSSRPKAPPVKQREIRLAALEVNPHLHYSKPTKKQSQPDIRYYEEDLENPIQNYREAQKLLKEFDAAITKLPPLSRKLKDWTIVLDPGHGGLDPGATVESMDGQGNKVIVVEDEYCYDIALRVYKDLRRHGAEVNLTVISPNHTIRPTKDASLTYVNQKNEVYNSQSINKEKSPWPVGNAWGLDQRKVVAKKSFRGKKKKKTLFMSIHADNNPGDSKGSCILYAPEEEKKKSEELARHLVSFLGSSTHARPQNVRVLRDNPAEAAVLVEIRNLAYQDNSWAIRNEELRQDDAERLVKGIVAYCNP